MFNLNAFRFGPVRDSGYRWLKKRRQQRSQNRAGMTDASGKTRKVIAHLPIISR